MSVEPIAELLRCPRCRSVLNAGPVWSCTSSTCVYAEAGFPCIAGKPALIDFADSIVDRDTLVRDAGTSTISRSRHLLRRLREALADGNDEAASNADHFLQLIRAFPHPRLLILGGGSRGSGTEALYAAADLQRVGVDIYDSPDIDLLADGHRLPFADGSFHGVWIQAVLEHVASPDVVIAEIHRVLATDGLIYAETPFLQPVHERAYDFTRFTRSGHRWLFRRFDEIRSGTIGGPAQSLVWSIRYLARSLFRSDKIGSAAATAFFWLRYLDRFVDARHRADAATGVFFLGRRRDNAMTPGELVGYFPGVRGK